MAEIVNSKASRYAQEFSEPADSLLDEIEKFTVENHAHANMLSGPLQGKTLEIISKICAPEHILEIGTFTGYSALCLAKGLRPGGYLHTIELREDDANTARKFFAKSLDNDKIILHVGNALEMIEKIDLTWDLVFIDADKINYINYYELALPRLKDGGVILADNVLFHGEVLEEKISGKNATAIHAFNQHVANDPRVQQAILTVRDGLMIIRKN